MERRSKGGHRAVKMPNGNTVPVPTGTLKPGTLESIVRGAGLTMDEFVALLQGGRDESDTTVLVHEDETSGYWGDVVELPGCASQGEDLDEMDRNIREAIELVLEVKIEEGEDVAAIRKAQDVPVEPGVRKWEISVPIPQAATA